METTTKSVSYHKSLIERLKDSEYAAGYLEAIMEEKDPERELLKHALQDVAEALGELNMSPEDALLHLQKLDKILSGEGSAEIYQLGLWLNALGLKLTVTVNSQDKEEAVTATEARDEQA
ncbi:transcriptional regulator [Ancylothrix sp. C2]|uniref:helix-turn-helix domain-containing transcriptional regulator n=1 Tax=Ancylothrix sp. D3o TaxID=2953691 RepID=UPI0021BB4F35|nr:transcriptional regulator [Ancylothrix sp. D3o]MCT7950470.1 transcriptional regulator [Ancylothrix sp. D3o]